MLHYADADEAASIFRIQAKRGCTEGPRASQARYTQHEPWPGSVHEPFCRVDHLSTRSCWQRARGEGGRQGSEQTRVARPNSS
eukprot:9858481-Alexandrium_andersonii.AAC.1